MTVPADTAIFAKQLGQLRTGIQWIGSAGLTASSTLTLGGESLYGTYAVTDFTVDATDMTRDFTKRYRARYNSDPDLNSAWSYDALRILAMAIKSANSVDREAIRREILTVKGYKGIEGVYEFDDNGDGLRGYNIVRNERGTLVFVKRVEFSAQ